jgi:hypothetical protein
MTAADWQEHQKRKIEEERLELDVWRNRGWEMAATSLYHLLGSYDFLYIF